MICAAPDNAYDLGVQISRLAVITAAAIALAACGGADTPEESAAVEAATSPDLRVVSVNDAHAAINNAPEDLVILDVRTAEEFTEGHIDGAVMLDFYRNDFAAELAKLDPNVPYVIYCRSGNRSGQTLDLMEGLGFQNVQDVDGGVLAWQDSELPLVARNG